MPGGATPGRMPPRSRRHARVSGIRRLVRSSKIRRRRAPSGPPLVLPKPTTTRATAVTIGPRVRRRRSSGSGAPLALACAPQERRRRRPPLAPGIAAARTSEEIAVVRSLEGTVTPAKT
jgi:hypothetical protein